MGLIALFWLADSAAAWDSNSLLDSGSNWEGGGVFMVVDICLKIICKVT